MRKPPSKQLGFPAGKRPSVGIALATIVAGEDDDRVLRHAVRIERLQYPADLQIHLLDHPLIGALGAAVEMEQAVEALRLRLVARSLPRPMRRVEMQADEKGLSGLGVFVDDIDGAAPQQIGQIAGLTGFRIVFPEILGIARLAVRIYA